MLICLKSNVYRAACHTLYTHLQHLHLALTMPLRALISCGQHRSGQSDQNVQREVGSIPKRGHGVKLHSHSLDKYSVRPSCAYGVLQFQCPSWPQCLHPQHSLSIQLRHDDCTHHSISRGCPALQATPSAHELIWVVCFNAAATLVSVFSSYAVLLFMQPAKQQPR